MYLSGRLSQAERGELTAMLSKGKRAARKLKRAQILLARRCRPQREEIARTVAVSGSPCTGPKRRFVEGNLERALSEDPRPGRRAQAHWQGGSLLVAKLRKPHRRGRRPLDAGALAGADAQAHGPRRVWRMKRCAALGRKRLKPWRKDMWCHSKVDGEYVARMEVCSTSMPRRPIPTGRWSASTRPGPDHRRGSQPIPAEPGQLERYDCRVPPQRHRQSLRLHRCPSALRKVKVTERRTAGITPTACANSSISISRRRMHPGRAGQPVHPFGRRPLRGIPTRRSPADSAPPRVPLPPKHASWPTW